MTDTKDITDNIDIIRKEIFEKISEYYKIKNSTSHNCHDFIPGKSNISYAEAIFDDKEVNSVVDSLLNGWLGLGPKGRDFTQRFSEYLGVSKTILVNSGSSADLLAITALTSKKIDNPIEKGEEIITPAVTFPTTLNPIIQNSLIPVFVDIDIQTLNVDIEKLKEMITQKTRAIMIPHTLGNPSDMDAIMDIAEDNNLYVIEDNCDALGSEFGYKKSGNKENKKTGSFGTLSTCSFYPAHHITMGEGGSISIVDDNVKLYRAIMSLRDWGRDCWCESDQTSLLGACGKRLDWELNGIKYDHRYIYSHIGYNLKPTEIQAAIGLEQINRIEQFSSVRRRNFDFLYRNLKKYESYFTFVNKHRKANPSWFAFPITVKDDAPFTRETVVRYLEANKIMTRPIFAGDIRQQPAYKDYISKSYISKSIMENTAMDNTERVMKNSFFIGVHPGIDEIRLEYIINVFESLCG